MRKLPVTAGGLALAALLATAGCGGSHGGTPSGNASSAQARISSAASAIPSADIAQAKALVAKCITGTPVQQVHTVHLVFLSSATGKNGPAVVAARTQVFGCLGVPENQRTNFENDALKAAEHARLTTHDGRMTYFGTTLPALLAQCQKAGCPA
jgi:hypothetical protein